MTEARQIAAVHGRAPAPPDRYRTLLWGCAAIAAGACGLYSKTIAAVLVAACLALLLLPVSGWMALAFFSFVSGFASLIDFMPIPLGPFNLYAMDFVLLVYAWTVARHFVARIDGKRDAVTVPRIEILLVVLWVVWSALGIFFLVYGYSVQGFPFDRAFGEFRRATVYSMAFFVPLLFPFTRAHLKNIDFALLAAGSIVIGIGIYRLSTGTAARSDENFETGHIAVRWMRMADCTTLAGFISLLTLFLFRGKGSVRKMVAIALFAAASALLFLSGFRLAMAFIIVAPVLSIVLRTWSRRESLRRMVLTLVPLAALCLIGLALLSLLMPELFQRVLLDLHLRLVNENIQGGFRDWTYRAAIDRFFDSPLIGQGFGYYLVVGLRNQAGMFDYVEMNNPHNMFLAVLYLTGLLGSIPFALFHGIFVVYSIKSLRRVEDRYRRTYIALFVLYLAYVAYMCLQPYVSSPFILVYMVMGFMVRLARPPVCDVTRSEHCGPTAPEDGGQNIVCAATR